MLRFPFIYPSAGLVRGMAPELRLVLQTAAGPEFPRPRRAHANGATLRWPLVLMVSEREKATPVFYRHLRVLRTEGRLPDCASPVVEQMGRLAGIHELRLKAMDRKLDQLLDAFEIASIPVVLLKGAALWRSLYASPVERPMGDLDLLVHEERRKDARDVARACGWRTAETSIPSEAYEAHHHLAPMVDDTGLRLGLELHTALFPSFSPLRFSPEGVWRDAVRVEGRRHVFVPSLNHRVVHAALHFAWSHTLRTGAWKTIRDIHALVSGGGIDWDHVVRELRLSRGETAAFWSLDLARAWAGTPLDDEVMKALEPRVPDLVRRALRRHFGIQMLPPEGTEVPVRISQWLWEIAMQPGRSGHGKVRPWSNDKFRPT